MAHDNLTTADKDTIHQSLEKASEKLGDITPLVYRALYSRYPQAEAHFKTKGAQYKETLEGSMVTDALFSFLEYFESPEEVDIVFKYTIPQHEELDIPLAYFYGLLEAVADVVIDAQPADDREEAAASWQRLLARLAHLVEKYAETDPGLPQSACGGG